jgi:hypothetical protein
MNPYSIQGSSVSNLSIKDVPEAWAELLRQRAARNHRSLQGELMAILERAVAEVESTGSPSFWVQGSLRPSRSASIREGFKSVEQVAAELRGRFPKGLPTGPSSIELIRQERDAR